MTGPAQTQRVADWLLEGTRRFGADWKQWKFQCPICGHVQTPADFQAINIEPQSSYQECIGRHLPAGEAARDLASEAAPKTGQKSPCDYAAYGLFHSAISVIGPNDKPVYVFPFAPEAP